MSDQHEPAEFETAPLAIPQERPRRFGLLRRGGGVAASTVVSVAELEAGEADSDFLGLEADLDKYTDLWAAHDKVSSDFIANPDNVALMTAITSERRKAEDRRRDTDARVERRSTARIQSNDFKPLVAVHVLGGRLDGALLKEARAIVDQTDGSFSESMSMSRESRAVKSRIESKRKSLLGSNKYSLNVAELDARLNRLEKDAHDTYKPIVKHQNGMKDRALKTLHNDPTRAISFLDTFVGASGSELEVEKTFITFIANDHVTDPENSIITASLKAIETLSSNGGLVERFIDEESVKNDGDNMLGFIQVILKDLGVQKGANILALKRDQWPSELRDQHESFVSGITLRYKQGVSAGVEKGVTKSRLQPDIGAYEDAIDRLWKSFYKQIPKGFEKPKDARTVRQLSKATPGDVVASQDSAKEKEQEPLQVTRLVKASGSYITEVYGGKTEVIKRLLNAGALKDEIFMADLQKVIDVLRLDPLGNRGVRSVRSRMGQKGMVEVNGRRTKLYRANPNRMSLSVGQRAQGARVLFVVTDNQLAVLSIPTTHGDYERFIDSAL